MRSTSLRLVVVRQVPDVEQILSDQSIPVDSYRSLVSLVSLTCRMLGMRSTRLQGIGLQESRYVSIQEIQVTRNYKVAHSAGEL